MQLEVASKPHRLAGPLPGVKPSRVGGVEESAKTVEKETRAKAAEVKTTCLTILFMEQDGTS
jgi:hypothetical protein